jgi:hypothetical protein
MNWPGLPLSAKVVHAVVWSELGCRPGTLKTTTAYIAERSGLNDRRVREALDRLQSEALFEIVDRDDKTGRRVLYAGSPAEAACGRVRIPNPQGDLLPEEPSDDDASEPPAPLSVRKPASEDAPHWESGGEAPDENRRAYIRSIEREGERDFQSLSPPPSNGFTDSPPGDDPSPRETVDRFLQDARAEADLAAWIASELGLTDQFLYVADRTAEKVFRGQLTTEDLKSRIRQAKAVHGKNPKVPAGAVFAKRLKEKLHGQGEETSKPNAEKPVTSSASDHPSSTAKATPTPLAGNGTPQQTVWCNATEAQNVAARLANERHKAALAAADPRGKQTPEEIKAAARAALRDALDGMRKGRAEAEVRVAAATDR